MMILLTFLHILLIYLFLKSYYITYFIFLVFYIFGVFKFKKKISFFKYHPIFLATYMCGYFDEKIFDFYMFFDLEEFYIFIGGSIAYILTFLHSIIFLFIAFKKK